MNKQVKAKISEADASAHAVQVCIVTGLSGAGKSTALRVFEDLRYFTVDGLPASLSLEMAGMMDRPSMSHFKGIALGMDMRQSNFPEEICAVLNDMAARNIKPLLLFLEADTGELIRRYATTRRPHPLEKEGVGLEAALAEEYSSLKPLRDMADLVIDTSQFSIHDLRRAIQKRWSDKKNRLQNIRVNLISFGFKYGVPHEADLVFDLRFLPNPYFIEELRPLSGKDAAVAEYIFTSQKILEFRNKFLDLLFFTIPLMEAEGRYRVAIAMGCTGGRHRSVAVAEDLFKAFRQADYLVSLEHRHLELN